MKLIVQTRTETPIYEQLFDQIRAQILTGKLAADDVLPSIRLVARELGISVIPVKAAYDMLEQQGYIYTLQGKGCFVANIANREQQRVRIATDSVKTTVDRCVSLGFSASEVKELVTSAYTEVQPDVDKR